MPPIHALACLSHRKKLLFILPFHHAFCWVHYWCKGKKLCFVPVTLLQTENHSVLRPHESACNKKYYLCFCNICLFFLRHTAVPKKILFLKFFKLFLWVSNALVMNSFFIANAFIVQYLYFILITLLVTTRFSRDYESLLNLGVILYIFKWLLLSIRTYFYLSCRFL